MKPTLVGSHTSPFVRRVRLLCHGRLPLEFKSINYLEEADAAYLRRINPINKLPVLLRGSETIFDSRVMSQVLSAENNWEKLSIAEENLVSALDGLLDTLVNLFSLQRGGLDLQESNNSYIRRQHDRIPLILDYLSPWVQRLKSPEAKDWNFASMSLLSVVDWAHFREMVDFKKRPEYLQILESLATMPGVKETAIPR